MRLRHVLAFLASGCGLTAVGEAEIVPQAPPPVVSLPSLPLVDAASSADDAAAVGASDASMIDAGSGDAEPPFVSQLGPSTVHPDDNDDFVQKTCLSSQCHDGQNHDDEKFFAAGLVAGAGIEVTIVDANGKKLTRFTDARGGFFVTEALSFPAKVSIRNASGSSAMTMLAPHGDCNGCHRAP